MSAWRRIALERLPSLHRVIADAKNYYGLWIELHSAFVKAYDVDPPDVSLIRALYSYASFCLLSKDGDMSTAVAYCFYEHLPLDPAVRQDVARWLTAEDFEGLRDIFSYHLDPKELELFRKEFYQRKKELAMVRKTP